MEIFFGLGVRNSFAFLYIVRISIFVVCVCVVSNLFVSVVQVRR